MSDRPDPSRGELRAQLPPNPPSGPAAGHSRSRGGAETGGPGLSSGPPAGHSGSRAGAETGDPGDGFRIGPRRLASLIAGRGAYRAAMYAANLVLLPLWGSAEFSRYAAAMGVTTVLVPLTAVGVEKAALKLLPRARHTKEALLGGFVAVSALLPLPVLLALLVAWLAGWGRISILHVVVGVMATLLGLNLVLVAIWRALGRPGRDSGNFLAVAAGIVVSTALAFGLDLGPLAFVSFLVAVYAAANLRLYRQLPRHRLGFGARRRVLRRHTLSTMVLMAAYEVSLGAAASVLYLVLESTRFRGQIGTLYLVTTGSSLVLVAFLYLLRVFQPWVSLNFGGRAATGRSQARRLARWAIAGELGHLAGVLLVALALRGRDVPLLVLLVAFKATHLPMLLLVGSANYLLENTDLAWLRRTAAGAAAGFVAVVALGLVLVPWIGAMGLLLTIYGTDLVHAGVILSGRSPHPREPAAPAVPVAATLREREG